MIVILGVSCTNGGVDGSYRPSPTVHRACTPEARETSERQKIHQGYVENRLKMLQNELDKSGHEGIITQAKQASIESHVQTWEEQGIKRFAGNNCRLNHDALLAHLKNPSACTQWNLRKKESLFEEGKIKEEEIQRARKAVQLQEKEYWFLQRLTKLLILANNYG